MYTLNTNMTRKAKLNQRGIVSLLVTMIMMLVISLIVIGFAQVARRNQRETLDRQLSTQAYYAAESGINVASKYIQSHANTAVNTLSSGSCNSSLGQNSPALPVTLNQGITVSCLMINPTPSQLVANPVTQDSSVVFHVQNKAGTPFTSFVFNWTPPVNYSGATTCSASSGSNLPTFANWNCNYGILRVDYVSMSAGSISQANLDSSSMVKTTYFVPNNLTAQAAPNLSALSTNAFVSRIRCSGNTNCTAAVTGLNSSEYFIRLSMIYRDTGSVSLMASDGSQGNQVGGVQFTQGQAVIDSTGKAQDELRRIQVRVPLYAQQTTLPLFGLQSTGTICKELSVATNVYADGCTTNGVSGVLN